MFSLGILHYPKRSLEYANLFLAKASPAIFTSILILAAVEKYLIVLRSSGGNDLLGADIPKSLMLLRGENPYSTQPWAAPYPPLLLFLIGGIIRLTTTNVLSDQLSFSAASRNVMVVGIAADVLTAIMIFLALKARRGSGLQLLICPGIFLLLPSISSTPYFYFHSDVFGYTILAASLLALSKDRQIVGTSLLTLATVFKLHPILSLPLAVVWLARRNGVRKTIPSISISSVIIACGLIAPLALPGYSNTILGFNLSTGFGNGTGSFTIMDLFYGVLPSRLEVTLDSTTLNQIWIGATAALFIPAFGYVWKNAKHITATDVILIGLLVWLIPLRQLYTHYVVWAIVPFLARGRILQSLVIAAMLEVANTMAIWSWNIQPNPFPAMASPIGFFITSLAYLALDSTALILTARIHTHAFPSWSARMRPKHFQYLG